jgi:hypothetical protein
MKERVQGAVTAGVALVGAGVMAAAPAAQQAPEVLRSVNADVALAAAVVQPPYTQTVPELFALSAERTVTGLASTPVGLATAAIALAQGQNPAAQAILKEIVDGPQWAADPAIYAFDDLLPEPLGGDEANNPRQPDADSAISQFRAAVLIAARDDVNEAIADSLGVGPATQPTGNEVSPAYAGARLAGGLGVSALRAAQSAVTAPLGLAAVAKGLQNSLGGGGNKELYLALQAYIDGPNYVTDPVVFAVDDVLPQAAGGGDLETNPAEMNGSDISRLRGNVLLAPRDNVRKVVAGALGVDPIKGNPVPSATANKLLTNSETAERKSPSSRVLTSLRATSGGTATASTVGKHRAPATGGLSNLFKKKDDQKKADTTPASTE